MLICHSDTATKYTNDKLRVNWQYVKSSKVFAKLNLPHIFFFPLKLKCLK